MLIGGLQQMTLLDYPGQVAATIFTVGCNFRCHFCHNPALVLPEKFGEGLKTEKDVLDFLRARKKLLDGVCITGGEPTLQKDIVEVCESIKDLGYKIKLDTNGLRPHIIQKLMKKDLIDYIAMDIKAPWNKYEQVVGVKVDLDKLKQSVKIIRESGLPHEFRSTVLPGLHTAEDIIRMAKQVKGADAYYIQRFRSEPELVNQEFVSENKFLLKDLEAIRNEIKDWFKVCKVR
ncbi:anaerobic ribonucleoside-triphosphate reductase activating protein [Candidatus Falkowbacteria bacterium CG10_big_fil_rev_8_21_14_0_10_39_11]|uniref:Anaerobic ribonucleoside-triphosphate reductase activating protein n=1 Tax=Candidatus Falkowbacteria bacterium CG10_big_fil_rev_8_21_14_0_10_39_11 TaxID=1974565 RepID=A0A2H0V768_9BACT|nr:MAG: anaerobic ribonucleoside-triphosphate reductase activating protein [Candidatus Falkowbacteria bacterium CG10_big_fil_rev_8_21_14_0_10_39_11]